MENISSLVDVSCGSIIGYDHILMNKVNQDSYSLLRNENVIIAVVSDGCGSSPFSEVGSKIGSKIATKTIYDFYKEYEGVIDDSFLINIKNEILQKLSAVINSMGHLYSEIIRDYFLFTICVAIINKNEVIYFSFGDGVFILNDFVTSLKFENNAPPYITYNFFDTDKLGLSEEYLKFNIVKRIPFSEFEYGLIGSDGVEDIFEAENLLYPGTDHKIEPINDFFKNDLLFKNPDALRRKLYKMSNEVLQIDWDTRKINKSAGLLRDDTTMILFRKKK
ncbi:MAG: hypothetical protein A2086_13995 [Spirochaetes bacterium GWD1_27_9]|nr:MAG: hypothetical protein A2Y34_03055 [Spirochaetes bacterium GWC1_27_15]OHD38288.1 MAG: hypothetical protein A2086_13995 [Spirochaetes bacterium GWD1_27_9]